MLESIQSLQTSTKVTDKILEKIQTMIQKDQLSPGQQLPTETELVDAFGVGRSSVREALQVLEHVGILQMRRGVGRFVSEDVHVLSNGLNWIKTLKVASAVNILEARVAVEVATTRLAAERATDYDVEILEGILNEMKQATSMDDVFAREQQFHRRLAQVCNNPVLSGLASMLFDMVREDAEEFLRTMPYTRQHTLKVFGDLLEALRNHDPRIAANAMSEHLSLSKEALISD